MVVGRTALEGKVDMYENLASEMKGREENGRPLSDFYERDHLPAFGALAALKGYLDRSTTPTGSGSTTTPAAPVVRSGSSPQPPGGSKESGEFGRLHKSPPVVRPGEGYRAMVLYKPRHDAKSPSRGHEDKVNAKIAEAAGGDPTPLLKAWLMSEVDQDADQIRKIYGAEPLDDVKQRVLAGVETIRNHAIDDY
jgi:hypothetical protein